MVSPFTKEAQFWSPSANSISQLALSYTRQSVPLMEDCCKEVNIKLTCPVWIAYLSLFLTTSHKQLVNTQYFEEFFKKSFLPQHVQVNYSVTLRAQEKHSHSSTIKSQRNNSALQAVALIGFLNRIGLRRFSLDFAEGKINERQNEKRKTDPDIRYRFCSQFAHSPHKQHGTSHFCPQAAQTNINSDNHLFMQNTSLLLD